MTFKRFNPFAEIGVGGLIFSPIRDYSTQTLDTKQNTNIGGLCSGAAWPMSLARAGTSGWSTVASW